MLLGLRRATLFGGGDLFDSDALLWKAAVVAAGGTVSDPRLSLVSTLIGSLKTNGVWTLLDRLWLLAAENSQSALIDLVARSSATAVNTPTFTVDQGYTGNHTTNYINTNYNLSAGTKFLQNDAHFMEWRRTAPSGNFSGGGALNAGLTAGTFLDYDTGSSSMDGQVNGPWGGVSPKFTGSGFGIGALTIVRTGATAGASYWNGTATETFTAASTVPLNLTYWIGARNFNGTPNQGHDGQNFVFSIGGSLTATQQLALYNAVNTYKTAIGA